MDAKVDCGALTGLDNLLLNLLLYLCHDLLDACGVDTAVGNELVQCKTCNLAAYRVECAQYDCLRCIVNHDFHTSCSLKGADVTALATDDAALHLVVVNVEHCHRVLDGCLCGNALDGLYHNLLRLLVRCHLGVVDDVIDVRCRL